VPDQRRWSAEWTVNISSVAAIFGMMVVVVSGLLVFDRRQTATEEQIKLQAVVSQGIKEHAAATEEIAVRDRSEMRDEVKAQGQDIKEIKSIVASIATVQKRGR